MKPFLRQQLDRYPVRLQELDFFLQQPDTYQLYVADLNGDGKPDIVSVDHSKVDVLINQSGN